MKAHGTTATTATAAATVAAPDTEQAPSGRATNEVYERLRSAIVNGELRPNMPLIEADLSRALAVSRTPIRESLQRLSAEGVIAPRKRGFAVREFSAEEIQETYEVRAALESYGARLAAERASDAEIAAIAAIQTEREAEEQPTHQFRVETNRRFHAAIMAAARNKRLADCVFQFGQSYFNQRIARLMSEQDYQRNQADHRRIVAALKARDAGAAEAAMRTHIMHTFLTFQRVGSL